MECYRRLSPLLITAAAAAAVLPHTRYGNYHVCTHTVYAVRYPEMQLDR